jgi:hypothetical protein
VSPDGSRPSRPLPLRWAGAFGRFWWDFLVGETPELFVGTVLILAVAALIAHSGGPRPLAWAGLPVLVLATLGVSLLRARPRRPR